MTKLWRFLRTTPATSLAERRARFKGAEFYTAQGVKLRNQQSLQEALVEFQKAYSA